jgi:hypothetical protein
MPTLFDPLRVGNIELDNRIIMAPMTRSRANDEGIVDYNWDVSKGCPSLSASHLVIKFEESLRNSET